MSQFSSNEAVSLAKRIELSTELKKTEKQDVGREYEIAKCAKWILDNNYKTVCLQFPDSLLPDTTEIVRQLEEIIKQKVYVLGDTAYGSCCIDYTAAKHISADAIIHFGPICFSKTEDFLPCLKIYEKIDMNTEEFGKKLRYKFINNQDDVYIILNTPYLHKLGDLKIEISNTNYKILSIESELNISNSVVMYVGKNDRKLMNLYFFNPKEIYYFDPELMSNIEAYKPDMKILKRRNFLMEKIKDSNTIGIVISTLAVKNYLKVIQRIKILAKIHLKKYYVISVGKPTEAKLANFPELSEDCKSNLVSYWKVDRQLNGSMENRRALCCNCYAKYSMQNLLEMYKK